MSGKFKVGAFIRSESASLLGEVIGVSVIAGVEYLQVRKLNAGAWPRPTETLRSSVCTQAEPPLELVGSVKSAHGDGWSDERISAEFGLTVEGVAACRAEAERLDAAAA